MKAINSLLAKVFFSIKVVVLVAHTLIAVGVIVSVSYFLGHQLLEGIMLGSDSSFALTVMTHLDKWFPRIPLWYPYQGAGQSMTLGYYTLPYYVPIVLHHITSLDLVQSMRLVAFLTVPIIGTEIYLYCMSRLKNPTVGIIAGVMYPLSSASWAWMTHGGFYAMSLSLVFVVPAFGFLDWYLDLHLDANKQHVKKKIALAGSALFVGLAIASHLAVGALLLLGAGLYALLRSQLRPLAIPRLKALVISVAALVLVVVLGVGIAAFYFIPQRHYSGQVTQDMVPVYGPDIPQFDLNAFLGFERYDPMFDSIYQPMFMSVIVSVFAIVGLILAVIKREKVAALAISVFVLVLITTMTKWINGLSYFWSVVMLPTNVRLAAFAFIMLPIVAAWGLWSIADTPFLIFRKLVSLIGFRKDNVLKFMFFVPVSAITVFLFVFFLYDFRFKQSWSGGKYNQFAYSGFGPMGVIPSFCTLPFMDYQPPVGMTCEQTQPAYKIDSLGRDPLPEMDFDAFLERNNINQFTRTDISTHLGLFTATANLHTDASMINSYNGIGALIYKWWGHETRVMFLDGNYSAENVTQMAKYFGIQYIFLHAGDDEKVLERYPGDTWRDVETVGGIALVKQRLNSEGLVSQMANNAVLVIGNKDKSAYEQVFKLAYLGGLSIDQGLVVNGKEHIDDYSLEELARFDVVVLHGYSYRNKNRAYNLLREYVANEGRLLVNTGWQYVSKDWSTKTAQGNVFVSEFSDPFPIASSTWGPIGSSWDQADIGSGFGIKSDPAAFVPPVWENQAWQMGIASKSSLASWAKPILSVGDKVVVAGGDYGKGKVVWTGFNFIAHPVDTDSPAEIDFVRQLFTYLLPNRENLASDITLSRNYPDQLTMRIGKAIDKPSWIYFKESYTPDWKARLTYADGRYSDLDLYKAGPGMTLIRLPKTPPGSKVQLTYSLGTIQPVSIGITVLTLVVLVCALFDSIVLRSKIESQLVGLVRGHNGLFGRLKRVVAEEGES